MGKRVEQAPADRPPSLYIVSSDAGARALNDAAFERLFREHYDGLARFAWRYVRDRAAAEDIVQDVFAGLWNQRQSLRIKTSIKAYLFTSVRNRALNLLKHEATVEAWEREEGNAAEPVALSVTFPSPDEALDRRLLDEQLAAAFDQLPARQAKAMLLRWREDLSYEEIAGVLGISVKGVEKHLVRGLHAIRELLSGNR